MKKWKFILILFILAIFSGFMGIMKTKSWQVITYFPIDQQATFLKAETNLALSSPKSDSPKLSWSSYSRSDSRQYLRQDASLLFDNGRLLGVLSKWERDAETISIKAKLDDDKSGFYQAISFHYGEIHPSGDQINSAQTMSYSYLYVIDGKSFTKAKTGDEKSWKQRLDLSTKQQLLAYWNGLLIDFGIKPENYTLIPLADLYTLEHKALPGLNQNETDQIIGQLWEGLYKNYIVPAADAKNSDAQNLMPIVLFDKQNTYLLVLFKLNGKQEKLIQQYPDF